MWLPRPMPPEPTLNCHVAGRGTPDVLFRLSGTLSRDAASRRFEHALEVQQDQERVRRIHVDLRGLEGIDLEGVAVLVHAFQESERRGKALTVEGATGMVRRRLHTTGILRIMEPPDSAASAS